MEVDGRPVAGPTTGRLQSLLAYLLLHRDAPQPRAQLAFAFWPDASEAAARNSLRQLLHQLRHALPEAEPFLRADASTVHWAAAPPFSLDVAVFESALAEAERARRSGDRARRRACLERALDECRGPLLPGCYDDWIAPARDELARRCREASAALVALLEQDREYAPALARVRHWLEHDAVDEDAHRWRMRLLALAGDRASALRAFRECADTLRRELGSDPSPATVRVHERIRDAEPDRTGEAEARDAAQAPLPLVGRQSEWARLRAAWDEAARGRVTFAVVSGEAGIGKSRLAEELLTWARRQGVSAAATRCYAVEGRLSLAPVAEWLRSDAVFARLPRLDEVWRLEAARILPELLAGQPGQPRPSPIADFADRLRFFEGLARAVRLAPPPLLLLIDDLQWCDRETLEWLHFLARFEREAPLFVLGTARPDELAGDHPLPGLLRQLQAAGQLVEIPLEPLDAAETARLAASVAERAFDEAASTRLYRETEGNPLFVVETVRAQAAGGAPGTPERQLSGLPPRVHAVIAGRLAQLGERAREVAAAAAVIGRAFDLDVLVRLVGDEDAVVRALDELWRRRIVRERGPNAYDFTHDRLRDVAYGETSAPQRRHLHRRVAEVLLARHAAQLDAVAATVAAHYDCAGLAEPAIPHYTRAALVAQGLYAHEEALALARRALALLPSLPEGPRRDERELELLLLVVPSLRVTLGWASPALEEALDRALLLCDAVGTPAQRVQALYGLQSLSLVAGRLERSLQLADEMARLVPEAGSAEPLHGAQAMCAGARLQMGRFSEASREMDELLGRADRRELQRFHDAQGINYEIHGLAWQAHGLWCLGRADSALEHGRRALALARELRQPFSQAIAATYLALLRQLTGSQRAFRQQAEEALELATEFKATYYRAWAAILLAYAETLTAPAAAAAGGLRAAIEEFQATGARLRLPYYLGLLAEAQLRAGAAPAGLACVEEGLAHATATGERWWDAELHRLRAELVLAGAGSQAAAREEAQQALERALDVARSQQALALELRAACSLGRLWASSGRRAEAGALLAPVISRFEEGLDSPDLEQARALTRALTAG